jgi:hypothetical protein
MLSLTISAGPKDAIANGEVTGGRLTLGSFNVSERGVEGGGGVLITSALTTPRTCLMFPLVGVMIIGASFRKSLA